MRLECSWPRCPTCSGPAAPTGAPAFAVAFDAETINEMNGTTARWAKAKRRAAIREATEEALSLAGGDGNFLPELPVLVRLTRLSPGELDDDAIPGALKSARDQIATTYGIDDRDPGITWTYAQAYRREMGIRVEVWSGGKEAPRA